MIEFMNCEQFALLYWKERERERERENIFVMGKRRTCLWSNILVDED